MRHVARQLELVARLQPGHVRALDELEVAARDPGLHRERMLVRLQHQAGRPFAHQDVVEARGACRGLELLVSHHIQSPLVDFASAPMARFCRFGTQAS